MFRGRILELTPEETYIEAGHKTAILCHLGNINITAQLRRRVVFNAQTETFGNDTEANAFLQRPYRAPWALPA